MTRRLHRPLLALAALLAFAGPGPAFPRVVDLATDPKLAPLQKLAAATAGTVIGYDVQLPALFAELPRRWTVWISEPEAPGDDRFHALRVRLPRKRAEARAPLWLR